MWCPAVTQLAPPQCSRRAGRSASTVLKRVSAIKAKADARAAGAPTVGSLPDSQTRKAHETTQDSQGGRAKEGSAVVLHPAAHAYCDAETAQSVVTAAPRPVAHAQQRVSRTSGRSRN